MSQSIKFVMGGDKALYVELGNSINPEINNIVSNLCHALTEAAIPGVIGISPTYCSILLYYDPLEIAINELKKRVTDLFRKRDNRPLRQAKVFDIPTLYGGRFGPDLGFVSSYNNLSEQKVIDIHTSSIYPVYMLGFNPGFPYLGGMSNEISTPRLLTARTQIPAGSVGIAESQTGIYPIDGPGGWRLIGITPIKMFDSNNDPPVFIQMGDYVKFLPIEINEYEEIRRKIEDSTYSVITNEVK